ncbi:MAG: sugar phosphate nucleotidyltransferase [Oscillospiraceae bacterium]|nr:sugar phosphate nucleotidyltransferase [Oscillospiraceae bacterium]
MNIVLLSGGSGKRLWPLSNDAHSKQFLKLLENDQGEYESMVERVMRQLLSAQPDAGIFVSSNAAQAAALHRHIGEAELILEPERRDTFPAIALAAAYLKYRKHMGEDEVFVVCPIDVYADGRYFELLSDVERVVSSGESIIGLLGALPVYPSAKYGYILRQGNRVAGFVEKPSEAEAERVIQEGALWNCGVFALRIGYVLEHAGGYVDFDSYASLIEQYSKLPVNSFDYEVVEKEKSIGAVIYEGVWKDLGTWNTLTEEMRGNSMGDRILISDSCVNTHVLNMLDIPVIVNDICDCVVVTSHDGVLVTGKQGSSHLKPLADQIDFRPMYEQRRWGSYRVLEYVRDDLSSSLVKRIRVEAGKSISYQYHNGRSEVWVVVRGDGVRTIDGVESAVSPGSVIQIKMGQKHSISAVTELELIEVQVGAGDLVEEDIVRVYE